MSKIQNIENIVGRIYTWICRILTPVFLIMAFSDDGFIKQLSIYMAGFLWLIGAALLILALSYAHDLRRTRLIEEDREEEELIEVKTLDQYASEAVKAPTQETKSERELISELKGEWKDRLNYYDYQNLKNDTKGYTELHKEILNLTKTWTRGNNTSRDKNKPRGFYTQKNRRSAPTPIVLNPHL